MSLCMGDEENITDAPGQVLVSKTQQHGRRRGIKML